MGRYDMIMQNSMQTNKCANTSILRFLLTARNGYKQILQCDVILKSEQKKIPFILSVRVIPFSINTANPFPRTEELSELGRESNLIMEFLIEQYWTLAGGNHCTLGCAGQNSWLKAVAKLCSDTKPQASMTLNIQNPLIFRPQERIFMGK